MSHASGVSLYCHINKYDLLVLYLKTMKSIVERENCESLGMMYGDVTECGDETKRRGNSICGPFDWL